MNMIMTGEKIACYSTWYTLRSSFAVSRLAPTLRPGMAPMRSATTVFRRARRYLAFSADPVSMSVVVSLRADTRCGFVVSSTERSTVLPSDASSLNTPYAEIRKATTTLITTTTHVT